LIGIFGSTFVCKDREKGVKLSVFNLIFSLISLGVMVISPILLDLMLNYSLDDMHLSYYFYGIFPLMLNLLINISLINDRNGFNYWSAFRRKIYPTEIPTNYLNKRRINASFYLIFCFCGMLSFLGYLLFIQYDYNHYYFDSYNWDIWWTNELIQIYSIIASSVYFTWFIFGELIGRRTSRYTSLQQETSLTNPIFNKIIVQRTNKFTRKKLVIKELSRKVYHIPTIALHVYLDEQTVIETIRIAIADHKIAGTFSPDNDQFIPPVYGNAILMKMRGPKAKPKKVKPGLQSIANSQIDFDTALQSEKIEIVEHQENQQEYQPQQNLQQPLIVFNQPSDKSRLITLLLCLFVGDLGFHRFYAGKILTGFIWLVTFGCFQIGTLVDVILISIGKFRDGNGNYITEWDTESKSKPVQQQQPKEHSQQYMQPTQPVHSAYTPQPSIQSSQESSNRGEVMRKIIKMYDSISIDEMAQLLNFTDRILFQQWLMSLPDDLEFVIHNDNVLIPPYLKDNTQSSQQQIDVLINHLNVR